MTSVGQMRHWVDLEAPGTARGADGDATPAWTTVASVAARVEPLGGSEVQQGRQVVEVAAYRVTVRYQPGLTSRWRVVWGTRRLDIDGVTDLDGRGVWHELICREGR